MKQMPKAALDNDKPYSLKLAAGQFLRLTAVKQRSGVPVPEQIRRAIDAWLKVQERGR
jgi:hypothetical protein